MSARRRILLLSLVVLIALLVAAGAAEASTQYTVTTTADMGSSGECATGGSCSLREAIADANANGGATIIVPGGTYTLDPEQGALSSSADTTLDGSTTSPTIVDGSQATQVLSVTGGSLTVNAITIQHGKTQGSEDGGGLDVESGASAVLNNSTVTGNVTTQLGGGIYDNGNLTLNDDVISDNTANSFYGGGLDVAGASSATSTVTIENTTFSGNSAEYGGGIDVDLASDGSASNTTLTVTDSALISNQASESGGGYGDDDDTFPGSVMFTNTTVADNTAAGEGGGLAIGDTSDAQQFLNDTVVGNEAPTGGNVYSGPNASTFENTIVAGGVATGASADCGGDTNDIRSLGHNLGDANGCDFTAAGDLVNTNPQLGSLQNNGGPTETLATALNSPAIDAGSATPLACPATDQRGVARPQGAACDIGAYESAPPVITAVGVAEVSSIGATIDATVANRDLASASLSVQLGTTAGTYPDVAATGQRAGAQSAATPYSLAVSGLQAGTTYHYEVVATTSRGTVTSSDQTFTTAPATTTTTTTTGSLTPPPPSNAFTVSQLKISAAGRVTATLGAPDAGVFRIKATFAVTRNVMVRKHGRKVVERKTTTYTYASATLKVVQKSTQALVLRVSKSASAELKKLGRAKVTVAVTFTPKGGKALTKRPTITVKRSRKGSYS